MLGSTALSLDPMEARQANLADLRGLFFRASVKCFGLRIEEFGCMVYVFHESSIQLSGRVTLEFHLKSQGTYTANAEAPTIAKVSLDLRLQWTMQPPFFKCQL